MSPFLIVPFCLFLKMGAKAISWPSFPVSKSLDGFPQVLLDPVSQAFYIRFHFMIFKVSANFNLTSVTHWKSVVLQTSGDFQITPSSLCDFSFYVLGDLCPDCCNLGSAPNIW
jgi:hypothetical protein